MKTYFVDDQAFGLGDGFGGEHAVQHVLPLFRLLVSQESEGRLVLIEAMVKSGILVPSVLVVVDVMVRLRIREVQLIWTNADNFSCSDSAASFVCIWGRGLTMLVMQVFEDVTEGLLEQDFDVCFPLRGCCCRHGTRELRERMEVQAIDSALDNPGE